MRERRARRRELAPLVVATLALSAAATAGGELRDPAFLERTRQGFAHIYNLEYEEAIDAFTALAAEAPDHPGPYLDRAIARWLRELFRRAELDLERFVAPGYFSRPAKTVMPPAERRAFFADLERAQSLVEAILETDPADPDARYYLGSIEAIRGAFAMTIDRDRGAAFRHGKAAYRIHEALVEEHPDDYDAYLSVGTYEYIVGNLPWYIRWLAALVGYRGSEKRGLELLETAAARGALVADDAKTLLMVIYVREKRYDRALALAETLHRKYPKNVLLHLNRAQIHERRGETAEAVRRYEEILALAAEGRPSYDRIPLSTLRVRIAERLFALGETARALAAVEPVLGDPLATAPERARAHLLAGRLRDALGDRRGALDHYARVLALPDVEGSHEAARRYRERPYRP